MKRRSRKIIALLAAALMAVPAMRTYAGAAPDGKTVASGEAYEAWKSSVWETMKHDWTCVSMTPGTDESQMNFAWYSKEGENVSFLFGQKADLSDGQIVPVSQGSTGQTDNEGVSYLSNKVTISGLTEGTTYYYQVSGKKVESFTTGNADEFTFAFVGDPQIGSSNEMKAKKPENLTDEFYQVQEESVASDSYNWAATLNQALANNPNTAFVVSAGDQIQTNAKKVENTTVSEIEYSGYLSPEALTSLPVATTVGNHDADNANYQYHFNVPNLSSYGDNGYVGGDYYFTYGNVLFMMLNTQDTNNAEHEAFIRQTVEENSDCRWKIVTLHQDIYGSAEHSNEPEIVNLRYALTPVFEEVGVDVVLTGHDHAYSRSKFLNGDQVSKQVTYTDDEFDEMFERDIDVGDSEEQLTQSPGNIAEDTEDPKEQAYLAYLYDIMDENRTTDDNTEYAINPEGILYMTASSSSGSKYYDLVDRQQSYIASRWQEDVPTYSLIDVTETTLTINTYRTDSNSQIDSSVTIVKTTDKEALALKVAEIHNANLQEADYTKDSWSVLQDALSMANTVLSDEKATEAEVADAAGKLDAAYAGLIKVEQTIQEEDTTQNGDTSGTGSADTGNTQNNKTSAVKSPVKTGDESQEMTFVIICVLALCVCAAALYRCRRER
ncbi:metallophosphoesterase [Fusicatenibacter saccharivorans]|uniref:metallophosphoesterase n=1 Tax=Fusicatenibacter saccharivorans TaxID=1150298 RepID=UPI003D03C707